MAHRVYYSKGVQDQEWCGERLRCLRGFWDGDKTNYIVDFGGVMAFDCIAGHYTRRHGMAPAQEARVLRILNADRQ